MPRETSQLSRAPGLAVLSSDSAQASNRAHFTTQILLQSLLRNNVVLKPAKSWTAGYGGFGLAGELLPC